MTAVKTWSVQSRPAWVMWARETWPNFSKPKSSSRPQLRQKENYSRQCKALEWERSNSVARLNDYEYGSQSCHHRHGRRDPGRQRSCNFLEKSNRREKRHSQDRGFRYLGVRLPDRG